MISSISRVNVLGVGISELNLETVQIALEQACFDSSHAGYVTVTGVHGVVESQQNPDLKTVHNRSFLTTPDGMPMVWIGRGYGFAQMNRVYGPEMMEQFFSQTEGKGIRHYFFGGEEGVAESLREKLLERYPQSEIVGTFCPPFRPLSSEEELRLCSELQEKRPHCMWVGLSTPKQELFMSRFLEKFSSLSQGWGHGFTLLGVGAAFDFLSGRVKQAPYWIQRSGFEWLYRLLREPQRLWKRYLINNAKFLFSIAGQLLGLKHYDLVNK